MKLHESVIPADDDLPPHTPKVEDTPDEDQLLADHVRASTFETVQCDNDGNPIWE